MEQSGVEPLHVLHVAPPVPQYSAVSPRMHAPPEQQPDGQLLGVHVGTQIPPEQTGVEPLHVLHVAPPVPHAVAEVPAMHVSPEQQPDGQLLEVHVGVRGTQTPPEQTGVEPLHVLHVAPPVPHAVADVPAWHEPDEVQHPEGQVVGPHAAGQSAGQVAVVSPVPHSPLPQQKARSVEARQNRSPVSALWKQQPPGKDPAQLESREQLIVQ